MQYIDKLKARISGYLNANPTQIDYKYVYIAVDRDGGVYAYSHKPKYENVTGNWKVRNNRTEVIRLDLKGSPNYIDPNEAKKYVWRIDDLKNFPFVNTLDEVIRANGMDVLRGLYESLMGTAVKYKYIATSKDGNIYAFTNMPRISMQSHSYLDSQAMPAHFVGNAQYHPHWMRSVLDIREVIDFLQKEKDSTMNVCTELKVEIDVRVKRIKELQTSRDNIDIEIANATHEVRALELAIEVMSK
jgi:hypothetical protein